MLRPETKESSGFTANPSTRPLISTSKIVLASACLSPGLLRQLPHRSTCCLPTAAGIIFVNHKLHPISLLFGMSMVLRLKNHLLARSLSELAPASLASFHATNSLAHCLAATEITIKSFVTCPFSVL